MAKNRPKIRTFRISGVCLLRLKMGPDWVFGAKFWLDTTKSSHQLHTLLTLLSNQGWPKDAPKNRNLKQSGLHCTFFVEQEVAEVLRNQRCITRSLETYGAAPATKCWPPGNAVAAFPKCQTVFLRHLSLYPLLLPLNSTRRPRISQLFLIALSRNNKSRVSSSPSREMPRVNDGSRMNM